MEFVSEYLANYQNVWWHYVLMWIISFIAYTPDIFSGPIIGYLLDSNLGVTGYSAVFSLLAGFSLLGLVATLAFRKSLSTDHQ